GSRRSHSGSHEGGGAGGSAGAGGCTAGGPTPPAPTPTPAPAPPHRGSGGSRDHPGRSRATGPAGSRPRHPAHGRAPPPGRATPRPGHRLPGLFSGRGTNVERRRHRRARRAPARALRPPQRLPGVRRRGLAPAPRQCPRQHRLALPQRAWPARGRTGLARRHVAGARRRPGACRMTRGSRTVLAVVAAALLASVGWRLVQVTRADELALRDPEAALALEPGHPRALLALAWRQYRQGDDAAASATARRLLQVEPGQGAAFAVLALAAERQGADNATELMEIALRRAPRDRELRTQAAAAAFRASDLATGLAHLDALLRLAPERRETLFPALVQQAADPRFGDALAEVLATSPRWRRGFLRWLEREGSPEALDAVYGGLQQRDSVSDAEVARWLDRMLSDGRWGQAYAHWFSRLDQSGEPLPPLYNGGFERDPSQLGFDWRNTRAAGVFTDLEPARGAGGERAAHFHFIGREAAMG